MNNAEVTFIEQADIFLEKLLTKKGYSSLSEVKNITDRLTFPLTPVIIEDISKINETEKSNIVKNYVENGVAYYISSDLKDRNESIHPILLIAAQISDEINLKFPLIHFTPLDNLKVEQSNKFDGTFKVLDISKLDYKDEKDVSETNLEFDVHNDGLGTGNTVENFMLYCDSPPLFGGFTFFYDLFDLALNLAKSDYKAFQHLFLPTSITTIRRQGAIKIVSPILYLDDSENPNAFFRKGCGEYITSYYQGNSDFNRGLEYLMKHTTPFCNGSFFVHFSKKGHGIIANNFQLVHSRTSFIDGTHADQKRILSKKWFMNSALNQTDKKIPGIFICKKYAELFPEYFGQDKLFGKWQYDIEADRNYKVDRIT